MLKDNEPYDPELVLTHYASRVELPTVPAANPDVFYELLSGALCWSDEHRNHFPVEICWALGAVRAYRTSLMLKEPREELKHVWDLALKLYPKWVGFLPERREPTPELLKIYRRGSIEMRWCLRNLDRQQAAKDALPAPETKSNTRWQWFWKFFRR